MSEWWNEFRGLAASALDQGPAMWEAVKSPQQRHAMLVHVPIAGAMLGLLLTVFLVLRRGKAGGLRWMTGFVFLLSAGVGFAAAQAGKSAVNQIDTNLLTDHAGSELELHEEMGEMAWILMLIAGVAVIATGIKTRLVRYPMLLISLVAALGTAGWTAVTAHHGGSLVYRHGVGTADFGSEPAETVHEEAGEPEPEPEAEPVRVAPKPSAEATGEETRRETDVDSPTEEKKKPSFFGVEIDD